jgi:hypothetical protein
VAYLLSETHPDGWGKARFFSAHGFSASKWQSLATSSRRHAADHPVAEVVETPFGVRYAVDGILHTPDGRTPTVRTVWFIDLDHSAPRLVTAFPRTRR